VTIEQAKIGEVAARIMEALDEHGYGEDAEIRDVLLIVAVDHETESGDRSTRVHWTPSPGMAPHAAIGLLSQVRHALLQGR
jgi:hypothetical protein